jgi:hypothetical protein
MRSELILLIVVSVFSGFIGVGMLTPILAYSTIKAAKAMI